MLSNGNELDEVRKVIPFFHCATGHAWLDISCDVVVCAIWFRLSAAVRNHFQPRTNAPKMLANRAPSSIPKR
eukprot:4492241-Amphidinium_carterae.2